MGRIATIDLNGAELTESDLRDAVLAAFSRGEGGLRFWLINVGKTRRNYLLRALGYVAEDL